MSEHAAVPQPGPEWQANPGRQPERTKHKRVAVVLADGREPAAAPVTPVSPPGWAADTVRWSLTGFAFDVAWFKILGGRTNG